MTRKILSSVLASVCMLSATLAFAGKGGASSGGGNAVYTNYGALRLIDFLSNHELSDVNTSATDALAVLSSRLTKQEYAVAADGKTFFSCAIERIYAASGWDDVTKLSWVNSLSRLNVVSISSRFSSGYSVNASLQREFFGTFGGATSALPQLFSTRVGQEYQISIAAYVESEVRVDAKLYHALSLDERCGIQVHEAVRLYGDLYRSQPFTTDEVEALTQEILGLAIQNPSALQSAHIEI